MLLAWLLVAGVVRAMPADGGGYSGLVDRELVPASAFEESVREIAGELLGGEKGSLDRAVVTVDQESRLIVRVAHRGLQGRRLIAELLDRGREAQPEIGRASATLESDAGEVDLLFEPAVGAPEGAQLESGYLRLRVLRADHPVADLERTFRLGKRWQIPIRPENVVVKVTPRPEGSAAKLRESQSGQPLPLPRRVLSFSRQVAAPGVRPRVRSGGSAATVVSTRSGRDEKRPAVHSSRVAEAARALPAGLGLRKVGEFGYGLGRGVTDKRGKGPGPVVFDLLEGLRADVELGREELTRLSTRVFQDQNPVSGILYFLPQVYSLAWSAESGYALRMLYGAAAGDESAGDVMVAMRLDAGIDAVEPQLAATLMRAYAARHPQVKFDELLPLPIEAPPAVSLASELQHQYEIPPESVSVTALSDALGEIDASWVTDPITKENLQLALVEEVGLSGTLTFAAAGGGLPPQTVPIRARLADATSFGAIPWRRGQSWRNATPYPARLLYLHALLVEGQVPVVYSWNLDGAIVPAGARAEFDSATVPTWIDGKAARAWIAYAPVGDCEPCDQKVVAAITGGVTSLGAEQITFHTITPLADLGAHELAITVRSRYFHPSSRERLTKPPIALAADNSDFAVGPIYLVGRQPGEAVPGDPLFEYLLEMTMPDGTTLRATRWLSAEGLRVLIGKVQVEQALGKLPESPQ